MPCLCGSQKRSTAPSNINPVNIGSLCFLFGVEGALCGFLDLIPETIKAVLSVNKKPDDADEIFFKWVKKAARKGLNIVIDEATGNIDVSSFCSNPPPPLPEEINFSDIFIFMAEVVPILDYWFTASDILSGNSTRLIDKVTAYWLFKQWYENCECKKCPEPPSDEPPPDNDPPPYDPPVCPPCADGSRNGYVNCKNLRVYQNIDNPFPRFSCHDFWQWTYYRFNQGIAPNGDPTYLKTIIKYYVPLEVSKVEIESNNSLGLAFYEYSEKLYPTNLYQGNSVIVEDTHRSTITYTRAGLLYKEEVIQKTLISQNDGSKIPFSGNSDGFFYPPCQQCPPPPPPPEFCDLYPNHPNCTQDQKENCETELVLVGDFTQCNQLRSPKRLDLIVNGDLYDVAVTEKLTCESIRSLKTVQYLECASAPPPDPCENVDCLVSQDGARYALEAAYSNGEDVGYFEGAQYWLQNSGISLDYQCCSSWIEAGINEFLNNLNNS